MRGRPVSLCLHRVDIKVVGKNKETKSQRKHAWTEA